MGTQQMKRGLTIVLGFACLFSVWATCDESCLELKEQVSEYEQCLKDCSEIPVTNEPPCANDLIACGLGATPQSADPDAAQAAATQISGCILMKYAANALESQCSAAIQQAGGMDEVTSCITLTSTLCNPTVIDEDPIMCLARSLPDIENQDATCADMVINIVSLLADAEEAALEAAAKKHGHGKHGGGGGGGGANTDNDLGLDEEEEVTVGVFLSFTLVILCLAFCSTLGCVKTCEIAKSYKYGTIAQMEEDIEMMSQDDDSHFNRGSGSGNPFNDQSNLSGL